MARLRIPVAWAGLLCLLALLCASCAPKPPEPAEKEEMLLLGFSQLGSESGWRLGNTRSIIESAERAGIELLFENAEQKQEKQIQALRSFIAYQADVIAFAPIVEDGWDEILREARDAGIPVLLTDRFIRADDPTLYAGFIGSDFVEEGRNAGRFLLRRAGTLSQVRIVELTGTEGSSPMRGRYEGFREVLRNDPRFKVVRSVSGDFLRSKGKECMRETLASGIEFDVLFSHNDAMTLGAIEAMEAAGLVPGRDIIIITVDGEQEAINLLKAGKINCVVECTPLIGDTVMELSRRLSLGETIPRITYSVERVFTEYDDLSGLAERGY